MLFCVLCFCCIQLIGQEKTPEDWGLTQIPFTFEGEKLDIVLYNVGKDHTKWKKPLFLFVQGSLPQPLLKYNKDGVLYSVFPFNLNPAIEEYHFVMIGKPGVPLSTKIEDLEQPMNIYKDPITGDFARTYCENNHLDYYVKRNKAVLKFLSKQDWVDKNKIVVAGHSEGVQIALKMAIDKAKMTHLVLLNAGLAGRIMSIITHERSNEKTEADYQQTEEFFKYWKSLVNHKGTYSDDCSKKDSDKANASFSFPYRKYLHKVKIPVFFGYGTKDESVLLMDNLRLQTIRKGLTNFYFKSYFGLEHSFAPVQEDGKPNYEDWQFDKVAADFFNWLKTK